MQPKLEKLSCCRVFSGRLWFTFSKISRSRASPTKRLSLWFTVHSSPEHWLVWMDEANDGDESVWGVSMCFYFRQLASDTKRFYGHTPDALWPPLLRPCAAVVEINDPGFLVHVAKLPPPALILLWAQAGFSMEGDKSHTGQHHNMNTVLWLRGQWQCGSGSWWVKSSF